MEVQLTARHILTPEETAAMEMLYRRYYTGAPSEAFRRDLADKDFVILLRNAGRIEGFSTQRFFRFGELHILFSGDTIVDTGARRQYGLAGGFGHLMHYLQTRHCRPEQLYWFLICKGARTYRFLPTFFRCYWPNPAGRHPELAPLLEQLAWECYPAAFDPAAGILRFPDADRLRHDELRHDPDSLFFRERNPGWRGGDELCCLAPLALGNLNPAGERVIQATQPVWRLES